MQIKFIALFFIAMTLLAVTVSAQGDFGFRRGGRRIRCKCQERPRLTGRCCSRSGGDFDFGTCRIRDTNEFTRCCRFDNAFSTCF